MILVNNVNIPDELKQYMSKHNISAFDKDIKNGTLGDIKLKDVRPKYANIDGTHILIGYRFVIDGWGASLVCSESNKVFWIDQETGVAAIFLNW